MIARICVDWWGAKRLKYPNNVTLMYSQDMQFRDFQCKMQLNIKIEQQCNIDDNFLFFRHDNKCKNNVFSIYIKPNCNASIISAK